MNRWLVWVVFALAACDEEAPAEPRVEAPPSRPSGEGSTEAPSDEAPANEVVDATRLITVGGSVTEIVFALGANDRLVGVDTSSIYPPDATEPLPKVGYQRQLSAEGVLALSPTLVIATEDAGPPPAIEQLRSAGVRILIVSATPTLDSARERIRAVGDALGKSAEARALVATLDREMAEATARIRGERPRVLFIYARGADTVNVAGAGTAGNAMIELAGGVNAVEGFEGYRPLTSEAAVAAAPDIVLMPSHGAESVGGAASVLDLPGISLTPAGRNRRVVTMDDLLLIGFGPRTGQAVGELVTAFHPEVAAQ
jgi:iron complex transport system substrate-binding protein